MNSYNFTTIVGTYLVIGAVALVNGKEERDKLERSTQRQSEQDVTNI